MAYLLISREMMGRTNYMEFEENVQLEVEVLQRDEQADIGHHQNFLTIQLIHFEFAEI